MSDIGNIWTIAQKEMQDALRNKWFVIYTLAFVGLALALSSFSNPGGRLAEMAGYGRTAASLINLVLLFVPLIGLTLGAMNICSEKETGVLDYLLAQPVSRTEVLIGKYAGLAFSLLASLCLGFGAAGMYLALRGAGGNAADYIFSVLLAWLLGLSMLSSGFLVSISADKVATAVGIALFIWLVLTFIGDLGLMGAAVVTRMDVSELLLLAMLNPLQLFKMLSILVIQANLEILGPAGMYATDQFGNALIPLTLAGLFLWIIIPLGLALFIFTRQQRNAPRFRFTRSHAATTLILTIAFTLTACGSPEATPEPLSNLDITMMVNPDPPATGPATLMITVIDENSDQPVDGALVQVHADMDHEGMMPVDSEVSTSDGGVYQVPLEWTMGGGWIVEVTVTLPDDDGIATETFELFVGAISDNSIINQTGDDGDHDMDMDNDGTTDHDTMDDETD